MKTLSACCAAAWFIASSAFADETWQPYRADEHGFSMVVPEGTQFAREQIMEGWSGLHAKLEGADFYALVQFGEQASREDLEKIALNVTKTETDDWTDLAEGKSVRGWQWFRSVTTIQDGTAICVVFGVGAGGSYLFVATTSLDEAEKIENEFKKWHDSIRLHEIEKNVLTVIRAEFQGWDADQDGNLTVTEVDHAFVNPKVRGEAAAALAVIKGIERQLTDSDEKTPPLTLEMLATYEEEQASGESDEEDYNLWFIEYKKKLASTSRELFPQKVPHLDNVKQGDLGDCFCVAIIGSMVQHHPQELMRRIIRNDDGSYSVAFAGNQLVKISAPTDGEIAINSSAAENGLWLTVLEKGCGTLANRLAPPAARKIEATDSIAYGGLASEVIEAFTGHDSSWVERTDKKLHDYLVAGLANRCLMYSVMRESIDEPAGLINGHVYAVIGYDKGRVTIFDPRGYDHKPDGNPGPAHGYEMKDGVFTVSLADFIGVFDGVGIEDKRTQEQS